MNHEQLESSDHDHGGRDEHGHDHAGHDHGGHAQGGHAHGGLGHVHSPESFSRAFAIGTVLNLVYVVIEAGYGFAAHSLALVADAGHNLSDVAGLLLAWGAVELGKRRPTVRHTYGMRRVSILAALGNAIILLIAIGAIAWEAVRRFGTPEPVAGRTVMIVASVGIVVNTATALMFARGRKGDVNIRGAFLHMAADAGVSAAVVIAGLLILQTGWEWLDPVISLAVVVVIAIGTWGLLRDSIDLALDAVPPGIDREAVEAYLASLPGVREVHDLHIWGMSTTHVALTAHLIRPDVADHDGLLREASRVLHDRFRIQHATLQVERGDGSPECGLAPDDVI